MALPYREYTVRSYFLNVGTGDGAVHVLLKNDKARETVIIDGGRASALEAVKEGVECIRKELKLSEQQMKFRSIVVTHWDSDHYGGLVSLLHTDWKARGWSGSTYINKTKTIFYCPRSSISNLKKLLEIRNEGDKLALWFKDGDMIEERMCTAVMSTWAIGFDLFSGKHYNPMQKVLQNPMKWPVKSLLAMYQDCSKLADGEVPVFLIVGIDNVFISGDWKTSDATWETNGDKNEASIMATVIWPTGDAKRLRVSLYTGGDAEMTLEEKLIKWMRQDINSGIKVVLDVVKAGHHGSHEATPEDLLHMDLQKFIISAGREYGHPSFGLVYCFLALASYYKQHTDKPVPQILCTRVPYWLVWQPSQLSGTDLNLSTVMSWTGDALAIQKALTRLSNNKLKNLLASKLSKAMKAMKSYYAYTLTQDEMDELEEKYSDSPMTNLANWKKPPLKKGEKAVKFYDEAIQHTWAIIKPWWKTFGSPHVDDGKTVQWVVVAASGWDNDIKSHMLVMTADVLREIKTCLERWYNVADKEWLLSLNLGSNNVIFTASKRNTRVNGKKKKRRRRLLELELLSKEEKEGEEEDSVEEWTMRVLSNGFEDVKNLPDTFEHFPLNSDVSATCSWLGSCFNGSVNMFFTGTKNQQGIRLTQVDVALRLSSATAPPLTFTTEGEARIRQFGGDAKDQTELGFDPRLEGMLLALDMSGITYSFPDFCRLVNFKLPQTLEPALQSWRLRPFEKSRSGIWFIPKQTSLTIMRIAMQPEPHGGLLDLLKPLNVVDVSHVTIVGICVSEALGEGSLETSSKLSVEATLLLDKSAPLEQQGKARISFTDSGMEVAFTLSKTENSQLASLLEWVKSIVGAGDEEMTAFESQATAAEAEEALLRATSGSRIYVRSVSAGFDTSAARPTSFQLQLEVDMTLSSGKKVPFLATLSWRNGVFSLSAEMWPRYDFDGIPLMLHPYHENTTVIDPWTGEDEATYSIPLMELLHLSDMKLPPGIPDTITEAGFAIGFGNGHTTASVFASIETEDVKEPSDDAAVPLLSLDQVDLSLALDYPSKDGPMGIEIAFDAVITLNMPPGHGASHLTEQFDDQTDINLAFKYERTGGKSLWMAKSKIARVRIASLYELFAQDGSNDAIMDVLADVYVVRVGIQYIYEAGVESTGSSLRLDGQLRLGPPDAAVLLDLTYSHGTDGWNFKAVLKPAIDESKQDKFRVANMLLGLIGEEGVADLPEVLRDLEVSLGELSASLACKSIKDENGEGHVVFVLSIKIGESRISLAQIRSHAAAKAKAEALRTASSEMLQDVGPARLLRFSLSKFPEAKSVPVIGVTPQPFDQLGIVWTNRETTAKELAILNASIFDKRSDNGPALLAKDNKEGAGSLAAGCHFQVVLLEGGRPNLVLDHVVGANKRKKGAALGEDSSVQGGKSVAPLTRTFGPLSVRNIGISVEGKSLSKINISLDGIVRLGPIEFALLGFSFTIDLTAIKIGEDLTRLIAPSVDVRGMSMAFKKPPTILAGMFMQFEDAVARGFMGAMAVSMGAWSAMASGLYAESKTDGTRSVFAFGMLRGPIFTLGCAEIVGLTGGFGYRSRLEMPELSRLTEFPFIALNDEGGTGPPTTGIMERLAALRGDDTHKGWVTAATEEMWLVAGVGLKAFQTIDGQVLFAMAISDEPKFNVLARATATFPKSVDNAKKHAFLVLDMVLSAEIDPMHGTVLVAGELTPKSYILSPSCGLTGGFAMAYFLSGPHEGDFAFTVGGYHPKYAPEAHYPTVSRRVGIAWEFDAHLRIMGEAYFAVVPQAAMGGGRLDVVLDQGWVRVLFSAYADFLMNLHPFRFEVEVGVVLFAEVNLPCWLFTLHLGPLEFSATVRLRGPPISGSASLHLWRWDVTVLFGPARSEVQPLTWDGFMRMIKNLRAEEEDTLPNQLFSITSGRVTGDKVVEIRATEFAFDVNARVPVLSATIGETQTVAEAKSVFSRPMQLDKPLVGSHLSIVLRRDKTGYVIPLDGRPMVRKVAPALWGRYTDAKQAVWEDLLPHVMGYAVSVRPREPSKENLPAIDLRTNTVELGADETPRIRAVEKGSDDGLRLVDEKGPRGWRGSRSQESSEDKKAAVLKAWALSSF